MSNYSSVKLDACLHVGMKLWGIFNGLSGFGEATVQAWCFPGSDWGLKGVYMLGSIWMKKRIP